MLFTGFVGAWLSAVFLIPKIYSIASKHRFLTFPQALSFHYNKKVAFVAGIISLIGYIGFTSSQILAGAKLASATFPSVSISNAVFIMGVIAVVYTVIGGIKAVIYTDTIQWAILMIGPIFIGIPIGYIKIGGWDAIAQALPDSFFRLNQISTVQFINWFITIVPIWFVGMTLYQRIYACKDIKSARKAWFVAGLFEWPVMAFMGIVLGMFGRVAFEQGMFSHLGHIPGSGTDAELGLPLFLRNILPVGLMGIMMSAYFSAIMSTADSCLMAASGNLNSDIIGSFKRNGANINIKYPQLITFFIGGMAILLATRMQNVLELMLYSYAFMVSGLLIPVLGLLIFRNPSAKAAMFSMITGGTVTLALMIVNWSLPFGLDPNFFGICASVLIFFMVQFRVKTSFL